MGVVLQMVQQNDEKHEAGHQRLRNDYRELEDRLVALEDVVTRLKVKSDQPTDVSTLVMSTKQVVGVVIFCCGVSGGLWAMNYKLTELTQQQQLLRIKVEGIERQMAAMTGRRE